MVANQNRKYVHLYAHLSQTYKQTGNTVARGELIGAAGDTGNSDGVHLHFHVYRDVNKDGATKHAVDLSPLVGFRPNLYYPTQGVCGKVVARTDDPIIIEPVVFTQRYQPREDHYWFCYADLSHTTDCYMYGVPNDSHSWQPLITDQSPELRYDNRLHRE